MTENVSSNQETPLQEEGGSRIPLFLRFLLISSLLLLLLASAAELGRWQSGPTLSPTGPGPQDEEIVPGLRIGFITLHLPIQDVEARLGNGHVEPTDKAVIYRFDSLAIKCVVEDRRVSSILTLNEKFHTRTGIRLGSSVADVVRSYGDRYEYDSKDGKTASPAPGVAGPPYVLHYWQHGVHFSIGEGAVRSIWVTEALNNT